MPADYTPVIVATPEQIAAIVRRELEAVLLAKSNAAPDFVDAIVIAKKLGVHARSVQKMVRHSGLPAHRFGKLLRYRLAEVEAWAEKRRAR